MDALGALVNHQAKFHGVLPYLRGNEPCEQAFATNAELQEHWKENHTKCGGCNGVFLTPAGLKLHQRKCVDVNARSFPSFHSKDSGVASDESRDSRTSEISIASSSLLSNKSRRQEDYTVTVEASRSKQITPDMRNVMFGLSTSSAALIFAHVRGIANVDGEILDKILKGGQSLVEKIARPSDSGGPRGSVSRSQTQRPIPIDLQDIALTLTYSPEGVLNPSPKFVGRFNRNEVFRDLSRFSEVYDLGVLKVGDFGIREKFLVCCRSRHWDFKCGPRFIGPSCCLRECEEMSS